MVSDPVMAKHVLKSSVGDYDKGVLATVREVVLLCVLIEGAVIGSRFVMAYELGVPYLVTAGEHLRTRGGTCTLGCLLSIFDHWHSLGRVLMFVGDAVRSSGWYFRWSMDVYSFGVLRLQKCSATLFKRVEGWFWAASEKNCRAAPFS